MRNWNYVLLILTLVLGLTNCNETKEKSISFYHWKSKTSQDPLIDSALVKMSSNRVYMHYFDVDLVSNGEIFPVYVLQEVSKNFKSYEVIPVVFITNRTLKNSNNIDDLGRKINELTTQIHQKHFGSQPKTIQLDCDWSKSTMDKFFKLVEFCKKDFEIITTIRLHQIKYQNETGVPPADRGVLMLYNVGDLKNESENSILETSIIKSYISENSRYPIPLDLALPLFSQTVIKNNRGEVRLLNLTDQTGIESSAHFSKIGNDLYEVLQDTLYHGFYLSEGYTLKLEKLTENEVLEAYEIVKSSKLNVEEVIFYHLDEEILKNTDLNFIVDRL